MTQPGWPTPEQIEENAKEVERMWKEDWGLFFDRITALTGLTRAEAMLFHMLRVWVRMNEAQEANMKWAREHMEAAHQDPDDEWKKPE